MFCSNLNNIDHAFTILVYLIFVILSFTSLGRLCLEHLYPYLQFHNTYVQCSVIVSLNFSETSTTVQPRLIVGLPFSTRVLRCDILQGKAGGVLCMGINVL
jgi:hypothetical protein